jgi:hypothetical protein
MPSKHGFAEELAASTQIIFESRVPKGTMSMSIKLFAFCFKLNLLCWCAHAGNTFIQQMQHAGHAPSGCSATAAMMRALDDQGTSISAVLHHPVFSAAP